MYGHHVPSIDLKTKSLLQFNLIPNTAELMYSKMYHWYSQNKNTLLSAMGFEWDNKTPSELDLYKTMYELPH